ncbi:MAG TPA: DUF4442 domain-containing protein [Ferruginibacter sp.]|nr:DUF4442 domain-containing protein [Ferruginibacter sp.]HRO17185.1 DUF4442 domain-containing protein [Ferruginibacter sp.]HRQ20349.1 DUF4442 domain-containing protein [Ferruginibacter sp.]
MNDAFLRLAQHPVKFKWFLMMRLPAAFFCGVRLRYIDVHKAEATVPYKWLTQNPFRSTYFACLAMAAEMSTGVLAMGHLYKQSPMSMLIVKMEARYFKKATEKVSFSCEEGQRLQQVIEEARASGKPLECTVQSVGYNQAGERIAEFNFTWSFKSKSTGKPVRV